MIRTLILLSALIIASCHGSSNEKREKTKKPQADNIVAKIGSDLITEKQLQDAISELPVKQKILIQSSPKQKNKFIESYINKEILYKEALKKGYSDKEDIRKSVEQYKKKLIIRKFSEDILNREITDLELEQYYENNKNKYQSATITQVSYIPKDIENLNQDELQNLQKEIISNLNKDADLGRLTNHNKFKIKIKKNIEITRDKYNKLLGDIVFNMKKGEISEPVKFGNSYVILKLIDGPNHIPFKNLKNNIKFEVKNNRFKSYLKNLKDLENIEIYSFKENKETNSNAEY
ncbi:MAG: hypothetical protein GWN11_12590 [Candidatus Dadabacteria bacterium]|nr:hypothetical protein [Candidatus Dadabacteria bacterium]